MSTSNLLACNYGTSNLEVSGYSLNNAAEVRDQFGRIGTRVQVEVDAYLYGSSTPDIEAKLQAVIADLSIDGRDFTITGAGSAPEVTIAAAACQWGGPFPSFEYTDGETPFSKKFKIRVTASQILDGGLPRDSYTLATNVRPDGLLTVSRPGRIQGAAVSNYFLATTVKNFQQSYPLPNWVTEFEYEAAQDAAQSQVNYRLVAHQLSSPLPSAGNGNYAVSGSANQRTERDENQRLTIVTEIDMLVVGDPLAIVAAERPQDQIIIHESLSITSITEVRVRWSFTTVAPADPNFQALLGFNQSIEYHPAAEIWEEKTYIGADPILVLRASTLPRIVQSGSAMALQKFFQQPGPLMPIFAESPAFNYEATNDFEYGTRWQFQSFAVDDNGDPVALDWTPPVNQITREQQSDDYVDGGGQ